eukprot:4989728-Amphidinium_carterae.1
MIIATITIVIITGVLNIVIVLNIFFVLTFIIIVSPRDHENNLVKLIQYPEKGKDRTRAGSGHLSDSL